MSQSWGMAKSDYGRLELLKSRLVFIIFQPAVEYYIKTCIHRFLIIFPLIFCKQE